MPGIKIRTTFKHLGENPDGKLRQFILGGSMTKGEEKYKRVKIVTKADELYGPVHKDLIGS